MNQARHMWRQMRPLWARGVNWWQRAGRNARIAAGAVAVIIFCCACSLGIGLLNGANGAGSTVAATATSGGSKPTATHAAQPTATPVRGVTTATLGGTEHTFMQVYGPYDPPPNSTTDFRTHHATVKGQAAAITVALAANDDNTRVRFIKLRSDDSSMPWSDSQAKTIAKAFLPSDAVFVKNLNVPDVGVEALYKSALLAQSFPTSAFQDANGNKVTPGTFYLACGDQVDGPGACSLQLGE